MSTRQKYITGLVILICSMFTLSAIAYMKISRELYLKKLLDNNIVFEIPSLNIKVPVLEGTDRKSLEVSAGHFTGTGEPGKGNFCIAGHNSTIYAEIFNDIDKVNIGDKLIVTDLNGYEYIYTVSDYKIVSPTETSVLNDFNDNRITIISCTDDGVYRQVIVGIM